ncbi:hypothetical protein JW921_01730, partial [Candidatus Fermentibacterales bacterium]|nr:hypothetical protein [Candidatus Fermentibacterales bacterium]
VSPRSNPVTTSASFRLGLARSDEAAVLSLLDAAGRLVRRIALPAGEIAASAFWPCEDAEGRPVPAGVYFAVLEQAGIRAGCRFVVIRP